MRRSLVALGLMIAAPATAVADDMPRYDVAAHCEKVASFGGNPSSVILRGCMRQEQGAYDHLKPVWAKLPEAMKQHCGRVATFGGTGTYVILKGCINQESKAQAENSGQAFKY